MTSSHPLRSRTRLAGVAALAIAVVGSGMTPLLVAGAAADGLLAAPAVVGPIDAGPQQKEVVLDWTGVAGAASYLVQVDTDGEWSDAPTLTTSTVASRLTLPVSLPHAAYVWRVAAVGPSGQGRWSVNGTFSRGWNVTANPLAPNGRVDPGLGVPTFSWTPVETASEYQLQVSTSPYFDASFRTQSGVRTESCFTTRTSITPFNGQANARNDGAGDCVFSLLGTGESRYWRVRPLDHVVDGASEVNTTAVVDEGASSQPPAKQGELNTTACPAPPGTAASPSPSASAPSASASGSAAPTAGPAPSASPGAVAVGGCEPTNTVEKGAWSRSVEFSHLFPAAPAAVKYYGDLVAPAGSTSTSPAPMAAPTLSRDVCSVVALCRDFPTVSWQQVDGAQAYRLYVALDPDYTNIQAIIETPGTTWTPTDQWRDSTAGAPYYVFVQPCTTSPSTEATPRKPGCDDPSAPTVFRKSSPKLATTAPVDGALLGASSGEVVLSWQPASQALSAAIGGSATSEAYAYHVQLSTPANPDFLTTGLVDDAIVDSTHYLSSTKALADGVYLWRVQTVDASGHKLPWSTTRTFTRDTTPPTFSATPTARLALRGSVAIGFSEPVTGIDASSVTLSATPATVVAGSNGRSASLTPASRLVPGDWLSLTVTSAARDLAGNPLTAAPVRLGVDPLVDDRSEAMGLGGSWQRLTATNAVKGTFSRSTPLPARQTAATVALVGRGAEVKGCVGPANGVIELWADGIRLTRIDTFRTFSGCGVVLTKAPFATGAGFHRIQVRGVGVKNVSSKGTSIGIDAITAVP